MQELGAVRKALGAGELDAALARLMCGDPAPGRQRVSRLLDGFRQTATTPTTSTDGCWPRR